MDSEIQTQPKYAEHTAKDALEGPCRKQEEPIDAPLAVQRQKNEAARRLLREWLTDDSGYDEAVWPMVKQIIEDSRLSPRKRFCD
ncbi:MAG TPA: hypothetical protein VI542_14600 [Candidatus Tectomicrobia bacterium]